MNIIDRYIIRKYLTTFLFTVGIFVVVIVIFDISEKLDDFLKNKASMTQVILHYYALGSVPFFLNMLTPLIKNGRPDRDRADIEWGDEFQSISPSIYGFGFYYLCIFTSGQSLYSPVYQ
jgi:hypothetical protein